MSNIRFNDEEQALLKIQGNSKNDDFSSPFAFIMEPKHVKSMFSCFKLAQQDFGYWQETDWWRWFNSKAKSLPFYDQNHILSVKLTKSQHIEENMI